MKTPLKENVVYESFDNRKEMMEKILKMIIDSNTDKILYKGNPLDINYKLMKKVMLKNYTQKIEPEKVRDMYRNIVENNNNRDFCIIYKDNS